MRRITVSAIAILFMLVTIGTALAQESGNFNAKPGDEVYVCGCGKGCPCMTISNQPGKCVCKKKLVKGKVTKVEGDTAYVKTAKGELSFNMAGKYSCACGPGCKCNTVSQQPGKCSCGKKMKKVEG